MNVSHDSGSTDTPNSVVPVRSPTLSRESARDRTRHGNTPQQTPLQAARRSWWREAVDYIWQGAEIEQLAKVAHSEDELLRAKYLKRGKLVAQAAEDNLLRWRLPGSMPNWVAVDLYREAVHWALLSLLSRPLRLREAFDVVRPELQKELGEKARLITPELLEGTYIQAAELAPAVLEEQVARLRQLYAAVQRRAEAPTRRYKHAVRSRLARIVLLMTAVISLVTASTLGVKAALTPPDLAADKPWHASSAYAGFIADAHVCDGLPTQILFHTNEEESPWFEVDLGRVQSFHNIEIQNREAFQARAVPLIVEVSSDHENYREIARQEQPFDTWSIKLHKTEARYVRARALRKTWLHLRKMTIR